MKFKILFLFLCWALPNCFAQDPGECHFDDSLGINWVAAVYTFPEYVQDVDQLNVALTYTAPSLTITTQETDWIYATSDNDKKEVVLTWTNTLTFADDFDQATGKTTASTAAAVTSISFDCGNGQNTTLVVIVNVEDTNNHAPMFTASTFDYLVPIPLVPGLDYTALGVEIEATDIDFSNQNVTFTVDPPNVFELDSVPFPDGTSKTYKASLKVKDFTWINEDTTYIITATDQGNPPLSSTAQLQIRINKDIVLPPDAPKLSAPSYRFTYSEEGGLPKLSDPDTPITLSNVGATDLVTPELSDDEGNDRYFTPAYDDTKKEITITANDVPLDTVSKIVVLTLTVTVGDNSDNTASSTILITIPDDIVIDVPKFSQPLYEANYVPSTDEDLDIVQLSGEISVSTGATVSIEGDNQYFGMTKDGNTWVVQVLKNLNKDTVSQGGDIILTLDALIPEHAELDSGYATLKINLPNVAIRPEFSKIHYKATYSANEGIATVKIDDGPIEVTPEDAEVTLVENYLENFHVDFAQNDPIIVVNPLGNDDLKNKEIILILQAENEGIVGQAVIELNIDVPSSSQILKFDNPSYRVTYNSDNTIEDVQINLNADGADITLQGSDEEYFSIEFDEDKGYNVITVVTNLPPEILETESDILLTMDAKLEGFEDAFATILIDLPKKDQLEFTALYYHGVYENDAVTVNEEPIAIKNFNGQADITPSGGHSESFSLIFDEESKTFNVDVLIPLTSDELKSEVDIVLTLEANGDGKTGISFLIIDLPKSNGVGGLEFTNFNYLANYVVDENGEGKDSVEPDGPSIAFKDIDGEPNLNILEQDLNSNFAARFDPATKTVNIEVSENLQSFDKPEIVMTIEAKLNDATGVATLIINLPPEDSKILEFSSYNYLGSYTINKEGGTDSISIPDAITFKTDVSNVNMNILEENYTGYIAAHFNPETQTVSIDVNDNLPEDILEKTEIILTIEAETDGARGVATLVVNMPKSSTNPKFTKAFYSGVYNTLDDTVSIFPNNPIAIASEDPESTEVTVIGDYESNFEPYRTEGTWGINVIAPLDQRIVDGNEEIIVTLQASIVGSSSTAALIISLPNKPLKPPPTFSAAYYIADYADDDINMEDDQIRISSISPDLVDVTIKDNKFPDNIHLERDSSDESIWSVVVENPLDLSDLSGDIYLELEAIQPETVDSGYATLVVKLPSTHGIVLPKFSQITYHANYDFGEGDVDDFICETIEISDNKAFVNISSDQASHFDFSCAENPCQLTLKDNLPSTVLDSETETYLILQAFTPDNNIVITATVVVTLPAKETFASLSFTENVYTAIYKSDPPTFELVTPIQLAGDLTDVTPQLLLDAESQKYFAVSVQENAVTLQLLNNNALPDEVLEQPILIVTIDATAAGLKPASTSVVVELPSSQITPSIRFSSNTYRAEYVKTDDENGEFNQIDEITLTDTEGVTVELSGENSGYFFSSYVSGKVTVTLNGAKLPDAVINGNDGALTVTIVATKDSDVVTAVLVVTLPKQVVASPFYFSSNVYIAEYKEEDGVGSVTVETDILIQGEIDEVVVELDSVDQDKFTVSVDSGKVTFSLLPSITLPQDILSSEASVIATIKAIKGESEAEAAVIVKLPNTQATILQFTANVYIAEYFEDSSGIGHVQPTSGFVTLSGVDLSDAIVTLADDNADLFDVQLDRTFGVVTITVTGGHLPQDILKYNAIVPVTIIASKGNDIVRAVVVIQLPLLAEITTIHFSANVYRAEYIKVDEQSGQLNQIDEITVTEGVTLEFKGDNSDFFDHTLVAGKVTVILKDGPLPEAVVNGNDGALTILIVATKDSDVVTASLVVTLPKELVSTPFYFSSRVYTGEYNENSGIGALKLDSDILIQGETEGVVVELDTADQDKFQIIQESDNISFELLGTTLPQDILNTRASVTATIIAKKDDVKVESAVIVRLPNTQETSIGFTKNVYTAKYTEDGNGVGQITVEGNIEITGDFSGVTVTLPEDQTKLFTVHIDASSGVVSFGLAGDSLPADSLNSAVITVTLTANKGDERITAAIIVNLPQLTSIHFTSNVYNAEYTKDGKFTLLEDISITGDDLTDVTVVTDGDYKANFDANYDPSTGKVTVTLSSGLSENVLEGYEAAIAVTVVATKNDERVRASIVVTLPKEVVPTSFKFSSYVYTAEYEKVNGDEEAKLEVLDDVKISGEGLGDITVTLSGVNQEYFDAQYDGKGGVTVNLTKPLSDIILNGYNAAVTVTIVATKGDEEVQASLVVTLPKEVVPTSFKFSLNVYTAHYAQNDGDDDKIEPDIITIVGDGIEDITVALAGENSDNFGVSYDKRGTVTVTLKDSLPSDIINGDQAAVTVTLVATKDDEVVQATLVVTLPKKVSASFKFSANVYTAEYVQDDDDDKIVPEEITIVGDGIEDVTVTLTGENSDNFDVSYSKNGTVTVTLKDSLPSKIINGDQAAVTVTLVATKGDETVQASLVVTLPKHDSKPESSDDVTGYIVAISIVSVLLAAVLIGGIAFYFLRIRRSEGHGQLLRESPASNSPPSEHFRKNLSIGDISRFETPTRRATGIIKIPLIVEDGPKETTTDDEPTKNVVFDDKVDEIEIEKDEVEETEEREPNGEAIYDNIEEEKVTQL